MTRSETGGYLRSLFEHAPVSLWEEDYSGIKLFFSNLREHGVMDLSQYLEARPEEIENNLPLIKIKHVNRETLCLFGAASEEELLANLSSIFRSEMRSYIRSEWIALWNGEQHWTGEETSYRLNGEALQVRLHGRILPESLSTWESVLVSMEDITALKQAQERYRLLFEHAPFSLWEQDYSALKTELDNLRAQGVTDLQAHLASQPEAVDRLMGLVRILNVNRRTLQLFEADDQEMLLANLNKVFRNDLRGHFMDELIDLWNGRTYYEREGIHYSLSGEPVNVYLRWTLMPGYENSLGWVLVALQDVTEYKKAEDYLRYLGTHDAMTGVYNRAYFEEMLQKLEANCQDPISFIGVDLDELKIANDTFGHHVGDKLIRRAAEVLKSSIEEEYTLARIGGDEFIIIMPGADAAAASVVMERVQSLIAVNNKYYGEPRLGLSLGAATRAENLPLARVIRQADDAMYLNKDLNHRRRREDQPNRT